MDIIEDPEPFNISIPKSAYEFPRVVPINIIISNTVVDLNSSVLGSVRPYHEDKLEIDEEILEIKPEETIIHTINVINLGNVEDTFELYLEGVIPNSLIELEENTFILQPNEYRIIPFNVIILENWAGIDNQSYNLTFTVISSDQATKQSVVFN
ncbi:MAG: COG1470 family protein [Candidatus Helarchaeota archaeon]